MPEPAARAMGGSSRPVGQHLGKPPLRPPLRVLSAALAIALSSSLFAGCGVTADHLEPFDLPDEHSPLIGAYLRKFSDSREVMCDAFVRLTRRVSRAQLVGSSAEEVIIGEDLPHRGYQVADLRGETFADPGFTEEHGETVLLSQEQSRDRHLQGLAGRLSPSTALLMDRDLMPLPESAMLLSTTEPCAVDGGLALADVPVSSRAQLGPYSCAAWCLGINLSLVTGIKCAGVSWGIEQVDAPGPSPGASPDHAAQQLAHQYASVRYVPRCQYVAVPAAFEMKAETWFSRHVGVGVRPSRDLGKLCMRIEGARLGHRLRLERSKETQRTSDVPAKDRPRSSASRGSVVLGRPEYGDV